jgi:hypothetical protein
MRPQWEVADLVASHGTRFLRQSPQSSQVARTLRAIEACRTAKLGGHRLRCSGCGKEQYRYNSCRNRHCPKCQAVNREQWIWNRQQELLPVTYFHVVFSLPAALNPLAIRHPKAVYNSLFRAAWHSLKAFAADPKHLGADTGMTAVLHTWGQNLSLHPHLHCIVPGGGLAPSGRWKKARNKGKFLFPTYALARVFRAKFMALMRREVAVPQDVAKKLFLTPWVVYAKRPFSGPRQVVEYLGRYTHKIAISNHRITAIDDPYVRFRWKDYRQDGVMKIMQLDILEFLRRFCLHILPAGFTRIRHYGILASRNKTTQLNELRKYFKLKPWTKPGKANGKEVALKRLNIIPDQCPHCKQGSLQVIGILEPQRGPPALCNVYSKQHETH